MSLSSLQVHWFSVVGALMAAMAVITGAFGAHGLKERLTEDMLRVWQTAVEYQMYHALGLIVVGVLAGFWPANMALRWGGGWMLAGVFLFSGSLYILALTQVSKLGMVTPVGGLCFILAWGFITYALYQQMGTT